MASQPWTRTTRPSASAWAPAPRTRRGMARNRVPARYRIRPPVASPTAIPATIATVSTKNMASATVGPPTGPEEHDGGHDERRGPDRHRRRGRHRDHQPAG